MDTTTLKPIIEAMIFVAEEPITEAAVSAALSEAGVEKGDVRLCLEAIEREWNEDASRGIALTQVAGGYQFRTKPAHADWLKKLNVPKPMRLSAPALETLAIVAYRQPIVRSELERIRGVDSGGVLKTLLERRLLRIVGRRDEPGQPLLYGTTKEFLEIFNLSGLAELPTLKDIEELMRERRTLTESAPAPALSAEGEDEEQTEVADLCEDEEETEIIPKRQVADGEEEPDPDEKDMEALSDLEQSLKDLRRLERSIFPKPIGDEATEGVQAEGGGGGDAQGEQQSGTEAAGAAEGEGSGPAVDADGADAPGQDDRPV